MGERFNSRTGDGDATDAFNWMLSSNLPQNDNAVAEIALNYLMESADASVSVGELFNTRDVRGQMATPKNLRVGVVVFDSIMGRGVVTRKPFVRLGEWCVVVKFRGMKMEWAVRELKVSQ
jgi:hypothetical protein